MPDPEQENPSENFSFVDKRRTVESEPATDKQPTFITESSVDETGLSEEEGAEAKTSIYDIAAYCTGMLISEGFQRMGLIADPQSGKAVVDLPSARVAIDCVAALVNVLDEPSSSLPDSVKRELKRTLNDLRLNYIDRARS